MALNRCLNLELLGLPNCKGLSKTGKCTWLNFKSCLGTGCKFKYSEEECKASLMRSSQRLSSLDDSKQIYIANKYYNGRRPWENKNR